MQDSMSGRRGFEMCAATSFGLSKGVSSIPMNSNSLTGVLPHQWIRQLVSEGAISATLPIESEQIQPASLDLRLGEKAYRVRASFLPGLQSTVLSRVSQLDGLPAISLVDSTIFEKGAVYLVELMESLKLSEKIEGAANPKSSTGRLDVLARVVVDYATAFDQIRPGYTGPLYLEVAPQSFSIIVRPGSRLSQLRFQSAGARVQNLGQLFGEGQLVSSSERLHDPERDLVPVTVDLRGDGPGMVVGYRAKKHGGKIDVDKVAAYDADDFWEPILSGDGRLYLDAEYFYILSTVEDVGVPPNLAAEMIPYYSPSGEFRVHYAGFFDPGFGWSEKRARGSKAVLEVRSYGVPFTLEHGQIVGWLRYCRLAAAPSKSYGEVIGSHYQGQGLRLSKHFRTR
jgi:dCTP deaminase